MIAVVILFVFAAMVLSGIVWMTGAGMGWIGMSDSRTLQPVDLDAFRNLVDPYETNYLRTNLPPREFRQLQRQRLLAALEYLGCLAGNSMVLLRAGQLARLSADPLVAEEARKLVSSAVVLRLQSFRAMLVLSTALAFPTLTLLSEDFAEDYERAEFRCTSLGYLQREGSASAT